MILHMHAILIISIYVIYCISFAIKIRASDRLRKKVKFCGIFRDIFGEKSADFAEISRGFLGQTLPKKQSVKIRLISGEFSGQILLEIDRICADWRASFNIMTSAQFFAT